MTVSIASTASPSGIEGSRSGFHIGEVSFERQGRPEEAEFHPILAARGLCGGEHVKVSTLDGTGECFYPICLLVVVQDFLTP
jgi:hypothetical protein